MFSEDAVMAVMGRVRKQCGASQVLAAWALLERARRAPHGQLYLNCDEVCEICGVETWPSARRILGRLAQAGLLRCYTGIGEGSAVHEVHVVFCDLNPTGEEVGLPSEPTSPRRAGSACGEVRMAAWGDADGVKEAVRSNEDEDQGPGGARCVEMATNSSWAGVPAGAHCHDGAAGCDRGAERAEMDGGCAALVNTNYQCSEGSQSSLIQSADHELPTYPSISEGNGSQGYTLAQQPTATSARFERTPSGRNGNCVENGRGNWEKDRRRAPESQEEEERSFRLLVDPEVGIDEKSAHWYAAHNRFEYLLRQVMTWRRELKEGRVKKNGALLYRIKHQYGCVIVDADHATALWKRHMPDMPADDDEDSPEARRRKYIPDEYRDVIIG